MFTQGISMKCSKEQYEKYLKDELFKMGYIESNLLNWSSPDCSYITNNYCFLNGKIGNPNISCIFNNNRIYLGEFNPDLFLALAAMTDQKYGGYGEYWVFYSKTIKSTWTNGKLYKQIGNLNDWGVFIDDTGCPNGMHPDNFDYFRKATAEEIMEHFKPKEEELIPEKGGYYYCKSKETGNEYVFISNGVTDYKTNRIVSFCIRSKRLNLDSCPVVIIDDYIEILRLANPEERQLLDSELAKQSKYFDKETMSIKEIKKENMKTFVTTRTNMQKIHAIAYPTWHQTITDLTNKYAESTFSEKVTLPEEEVQKMFKAATPSQIETLYEVFPDYNEDKNIFIKNPTSDQIRDLNDALRALCPDFTVEMVNNAGDAMNRPDLKGRGLYVSSFIKVIVHEVGGGSIIEFVKK